MKKKYVMTIAAFVMLAGCSTVKNNTAAAESDQPSEETIAADSAIQETAVTEVIVSEAEIMGNPSDSEEIYTNSDIVAIAYIQKIEGCSNINKETGEYCYPYTYGILEISEVLKGDVPEQTVEFIRMGGTVTWEDYYNSLHDAQKQKRDQETEKNPDYVDCHFEGDINIEEGKSYLLYIADSESGYVIHGWQGGLREFSDGKVLNNYTGEWQTLSEVIPAE